MESKSYQKIAFLLGFLLLSVVSCWATAESLHMLLPSWPIYLCWGVTVSFFVMASYGGKMITDSLNQNIYVENRGWMLLGGVIIMLLFWLVCSLPTNTHTFFYRSVAADVIQQDLSATKGYLVQLRDNVKSENEIKNRKEELQSKVWTQVVALENEIDNIANPGFGEKARAQLDRIATLLQVGQIPMLSHRVTLTPAEKKKLKQQYRTMVSEILKTRLSEMESNYRKPQEKTFKPLAAKQVKNIEKMETYVAQMHAAGSIDQNVITNADIVLKQGYGTIRTYADFITFKSSDRESYLEGDIITQPTRLLSVIEVWKDYFNGRYNGRGFIFWILIAVVVDLAAFIFFSLAFKRED